MSASNKRMAPTPSPSQSATQEGVSDRFPVNSSYQQLPDATNSLVSALILSEEEKNEQPIIKSPQNDVLIRQKKNGMISKLCSKLKALTLFNTPSPGRSPMGSSEAQNVKKDAKRRSNKNTEEEELPCTKIEYKKAKSQKTRSEPQGKQREVIRKHFEESMNLAVEMDSNKSKRKTDKSRGQSTIDTITKSLPTLFSRKKKLQAMFKTNSKIDRRRTT